eukprot:CAMPEP_0115434552 /NCGR_PEP_ID=MMETSP0271-20121206/33204_1 /TAXON_ID=71861 /ORGANISM="Scrippsiella trochoidea, Strain CCMP3099" /LENGTH=415 /DNA_ID=CAMNT_0002859985 /DNA_START=150 /DNA_END=1395 /DNA_ORIENTATION=+
MPLMAEPLALLPMLPPGLIPAPLLGAANGQGPTLAGSWSADIVQYTGGMVTKGHMFYDRTHQRIRQIIDSHQAIFTQDDRMHFDSVTVNATGLNQNVTVGLGADAVCKAMSMPYVDQFAVFALAHHTGSGVVDGVPCEVWTAEVPSANASACIAADGVPRELNSSAGWGLTRVRLGNVTVGPLDPAIFAISLACANRYPTKPCPEGGPRTFSVYRIHGAEEPPELTDRNVGDGLGDMSFVCAIGALEAYRTKLVSSWVLTANASWGQYAYCRFMGGKNSCYGGTGKQVGRESAMGLGKGHLQGQCSTNDDKGVGTAFQALASVCLVHQLVLTAAHGDLRCASERWLQAASCRTAASRRYVPRSAAMLHTHAPRPSSGLHLLGSVQGGLSGCSPAGLRRLRAASCLASHACALLTQ